MTLWERMQAAVTHKQKLTGWSEIAIMESVKLSPQFMAKTRWEIETKVRTNYTPKNTSLVKLAQACGVRPRWLIDEEGEMFEDDALTPNQREAMERFDWQGVSAAEYDEVQRELVKRKPESGDRAVAFWSKEIREILLELKKRAAAR